MAGALLRHLATELFTMHIMWRPRQVQASSWLGAGGVRQYSSGKCREWVGCARHCQHSFFRSFNLSDFLTDTIPPPSPTPTLTLIPFLSYPFMSVYLSLFSKYLLPIALLLLPYSIALSLSLCAPPPLLWPRMAQRHSHAHRRGGKCSGRRTCVA